MLQLLTTYYEHPVLAGLILCTTIHKMSYSGDEVRKVSVADQPAG